MKTINFGQSSISEAGHCYVIAEIGHNHQGCLETALKMIKYAALCEVQAVKFQKRDNKSLYTKAYYNRLYDNVNSYGKTYGEHREYLEFGRDEYIELMNCARENNVEFMATAFDIKSVDFLEDLGITSYKTASGDITNTPLLDYIAKTGKPMFISTGASTLDEIRSAYDTIISHHNKLCLMHCTAEYPAEYHNLNLQTLQLFKKEFPEAIIGYSGHDNGILASVIAYMYGVRVIEKHFTLNRAWKGTDHKFSLEPEGLRKQVRDLQRVAVSLGDIKSGVYDFEKPAREKMGKGVYTSRALSAGTILTSDNVCLKTPANEIQPYKLKDIIGKKIKTDLDKEASISMDLLL